MVPRRRLRAWNVQLGRTIQTLVSHHVCPVLLALSTHLLVPLHRLCVRTVRLVHITRPLANLPALRAQLENIVLILLLHHRLCVLTVRRVHTVRTQANLHVRHVLRARTIQAQVSQLVLLAQLESTTQALVKRHR